jgi:adenylate kinase
MKKDIVLFGIQWSGKWTQADLLMKDYPSYKYLEPWQIFRALTSNKNIISDHIVQRMSQWKMLDDNLAFDLFNMYGHLLTKDDCMLTDWFPRSLPQMYYFLSKEAKYQRDFIWIHFYLSKEKAIERLLQRAKEQWRRDDTRESIIKRLELFEKETLPVIKYFEQIGKLIVINAYQPANMVYKDFLRQLNEFDCM